MKFLLSKFVNNLKPRDKMITTYLKERIHSHFMRLKEEKIKLNSYNNYDTFKYRNENQEIIKEIDKQLEIVAQWKIIIDTT